MVQRVNQPHIMSIEDDDLSEQECVSIGRGEEWRRLGENGSQLLWTDVGEWEDGE